MTLILSGTDGLSDVDGTAATPALRGTDANTGIFFPAADTIAFAEGGAEVARFDSSGNLGIGTSSPQSLLDVTGNDPTIRLTDNGGSPIATFSMRSSDATYRIRDVTNSTDRLTINANGAVALSGASASATGIGITFPATQSASTDANTLDDYEEGTFTPAFSRSGINVAYTSRNGFYTRVGRVVTLCCDLQLGAITAQGSGVLFLGALPFTGAVGQYANVGVVSYNTVFDTVVVRTCWVYNNALAFNAVTNNVNEYAGNVVASGYLSLTISYTLS
jgi:hypothetical protein